ncbi:iron-containing alcohol dehydrogenase [Zongyangia hominis]|uniref:Iron-containing alcohol dehydrogenase n=1 Tax=Zongyangia hominis TaxID=2763677 RepID=A0A926EFB5_9FIRM|nr:iron-containing alcohol dehydrogenase [Zongyangia hominis]MBC8571119.1 iron-containing alcohol dehydrogenase [Zongyangia hominis]
MSHLFITPSKIVSGPGALEDAAATIAGLGKKALIVTDAMMCKLGNVKKVTDVLESQGVPYSIYDGINSEPADTMIDAGLKQYQSEQCDFLIAVGGGSPMDSMKAIALLAAGGGSITSYMGKTVTFPLAPMVAIPTTAGTGSEATQFTIITDTKNDVKMLLKGPSLMPDLAIVDPQFTMTAPAKITAATGMDALTHAIEAFTSKKAQPLSDTFAVSAVQRIFSYLLTAFQHPDDVEARTQMALAALEAGIAFNNSSVTIVHGMSRPIGALFHVAHGISNAMLLETCLNYVLDGALDRFAFLARACGMAGPSVDDKTAAKALICQVAKLAQALEIPTLEEYGINKDAFYQVIPKMAQDAFESGSPSNTRKEITPADMEMLYDRLWK